MAFVELISSTRPLCFLSGRNDAFWLLSGMIWRQMGRAKPGDSGEPERRALPPNPQELQQ